MSAWACDRRGAGALVDLVEIQRLKADATLNAAGEVLQHDDDNWETVSSEWAELHFVSGDELGQPTQQIPVGRWELRFRFHPGTQAITPLMRIRLPDSATPLYITSVFDPDRKRRWIQVSAKEQVA